MIAIVKALDPALLVRARRAEIVRSRRRNGIDACEPCSKRSIDHEVWSGARIVLSVVVDRLKTKIVRNGVGASWTAAAINPETPI